MSTIEFAAVGFRSLDSLSDPALKFAESSGVAKAYEALTSLLAEVPKKGAAIIANRNLSAEGQHAAKREAGQRATANIIAAVKPSVARLSGELRALRQGAPADTAPITRKELMESIGVQGGALSFAGQDLANQIEWWRRFATEAGAGMLHRSLLEASANGNVIPHYALDSLPAPVRREAMLKQVLSEESIEEARGLAREAISPEAMKGRRLVVELGRYLINISRGAFQMLERGNLTAGDSGSDDLWRALQPLNDELIVLGETQPPKQSAPLSA